MTGTYGKVKRWRQNMKRKLVQAFGGKCGACGLIDDDIVYDFHHLDPTKKEVRLAYQIQSWETIVAEANKCVMLCSHCHRKFHAGMIELSEDIPRFKFGRITSFHSTMAVQSADNR